MAIASLQFPCAEKLIVNPWNEFMTIAVCINRVIDKLP